MTQILRGLSANITDTFIKVAEDPVLMSRRNKFQDEQVEGGRMKDPEMLYEIQV